MRLRLSRRTLLRGAGVAIGLPVLDAMLTDRGLFHGRAQAAPPVRLVTFFWANGPRGSKWAPSAVGALDASTLGPCMRDAFAPVAGKPDVLPYINVVTGLGADDTWKSGHSCAMMACGYGGGDDHNNFGNWPTAASIDQILAAKLGTTTRLPSLAVTPYKPYTDLPGWAYLSWKDGGKPIPPYRSPKDVWALLVGPGAGAAAGDPGAAARAASRRKTLLDFIADDTKRLQARLGAADRARVDEHLASIAELERLLTAPAAAPGAGCSAPADPTGLPADEAFLKLIALAFRCDYTRYASFMLDTASGQRTFPADPTGGDHDLSHNADDDRIVKRTNIKLGYLASLMRDLASTPEGNGTLLDNSLIYCCSDVVDGKTHGREPSAAASGMAVVVGGRAGGALKAGRHLGFPKRRLTDLMSSLLTYGGVPTDKYGPNGAGPLPGF
jgi:hypothetical protein